MLEELSKIRKRVFLRIPQSEYVLVSEVMRLGNIIKQDYEENDILLEVEIPSALENRLQSYIQHDG